MIRYLAPLVLLCSAAFAQGQEAPSIAPESGAPTYVKQAQRILSSRIRTLVEGEMEQWRVPGAAVAVVERGEIIFLQGFGLSDVALQTPVDPEGTVFHVASVSKPVTASAVLQLVDRNQLDLGADINSYLKKFQVGASFPEPVTPAHLLTHTGGFDERIIARKTRRPEDLLQLAEYLGRRLPPRIRPPGKLSVYSNHGYALAGLLVEQITGLPFAEAVQQRLFSPLKMNHSSFSLDPEIEAQLATGYGWKGLDADPVPLDYIQTGPASMLRTTASDMARWMLAMLGGGELDGRQVLSRARTELLLTRQFSNHPSIPGRSFGLSEGSRFRPPELFHSGGTPGFTSALVLIPSERAGVFVAFNSQAWIWGVVNSILDHWEDPRGPVAEFDGVPVDTSRFTGFYREMGIAETNIEKLASLVSQERVEVAGTNEIRWRGDTYRAVEPLAFRRVGGRSLVGFVEENNEITYLSYPGTVQKKVSLLESLPVQLGMWTLFLLVFLAGCGGWLGPILPSSRRRLRTIFTLRSRWPLLLAGLASLFNLLFMILLGVTLARALEGGGELHYRVPWHLEAVLALPLVSLVLTAPVVVATIAAWVRRDWALSTRLRLTIVTLLLVVFAVHLNTWNLLGFKF